MRQRRPWDADKGVAGGLLGCETHVALHDSIVLLDQISRA